MKNIYYRTLIFTLKSALLITLIFQIGFATTANADAPAAPTENWEDISDAFTKQIGVDDVNPIYFRRCSGLMVTPTGDVFILTANKNGVCVSKDQGATWSVVADNKITGVDNNGFEFSMAYPYDGRMAFFGQDGTGTESGGITLDNGQTWRPFFKYKRGLEFADLDWNTHDPQTILGLTHEPYFTVLSNDGGKSWQQIYTDETGGRDEANYGMGVINAKTFVRANANARTGKSSELVGTIELSDDAGQTWTQVANYRVLGTRPVHYGPNIYWTTAQGVIKTSNGKDWTLTGPGAEGAKWGPYFGSSEQEFLVVTAQSFLKTEDGGKTWKPIAKFFAAPGMIHPSNDFCYFGWDAKNNILYASGCCAAVYRLKL